MKTAIVLTLCWGFTVLYAMALARAAGRPMPKPPGLEYRKKNNLRGGAAVARMAHNHEVLGSSPSPVTNFRRSVPVVSHPREAQPAQAGLRPVGWWLVFHGILS